jgi:heptosyltransferase-2
VKGGIQGSSTGLGYRILVIQTAFLGDAILASSVLETLHFYLPDAEIDFMCTKASASLFKNHPFLIRVLAWNKSKHKYKNLFKLIKSVWGNSYTHVFNLQRYAATGFLTATSGAGQRIGFNKNPLSFAFTRSVPHIIKENWHEIDRNFSIIQSCLPLGATVKPPRLYASDAERTKIQAFQTKPYLVMAPASVWATKMWPEEHWAQLIERFSEKFTIYLIGGETDIELCERLARSKSLNDVISMAGKLSLMESAVLMQGAIMNYVQDSGPVHLASSFNAPVTVIFCSTIPKFGFGPLSDNKIIIETTEKLACRPCGLHGYNTCPQGHFKCGWGIKPIDISSLEEDL